MCPLSFLPFQLPSPWPRSQSPCVKSSVTCTKGNCLLCAGSPASGRLFTCYSGLPPFRYPWKTRLESKLPAPHGTRGRGAGRGAGPGAHCEPLLSPPNGAGQPLDTPAPTEKGEKAGSGRYEGWLSCFNAQAGFEIKIQAAPRLKSAEHLGTGRCTASVSLTDRPRAALLF